MLIFLKNFFILRDSQNAGWKERSKTPIGVAKIKSKFVESNGFLLHQSSTLSAILLAWMNKTLGDEQKQRHALETTILNLTKTPMK